MLVGTWLQLAIGLNISVKPWDAEAAASTSSYHLVVGACARVEKGRYVGGLEKGRPDTHPLDILDLSRS